MGSGPLGMGPSVLGCLQASISNAITKLWDQGLFSDIQIEKTKIEGNSIHINLYLEERARLSKFKFNGIKKGTKTRNASASCISCK